MSNTVLSFWDQQFRFASILPDFQRWLDITGQRSIDVNNVHATPEILPYGNHPRQIVELFTISKNAVTETPLLPVFIHGGFWRAQAAATYRCIMPGLSAFGPKQANIEYRLMPEVRMPDLVSDVKHALKCLLEQTSYRYKLLLFGHSAGGHLVMEAALDGALQEHITAMIPISGIFDLTPIPHSFLQAELALTNEEVQQCSPLFRVSEQTVPCKVMPVVGELETCEFHRQAEMLAITKQCPVLRVKTTHHMNVLQGLFAADTPFISVIKDFLANKPTPASVEVNL